MRCTGNCARITRSSSRQLAFLAVILAVTQAVGNFINLPRKSSVAASYAIGSVAIVYGLGSNKGMPPFGEILEPPQVELIHQYIIQRSHDLRDELLGTAPVKQADQVQTRD